MHLMYEFCTCDNYLINQLKGLTFYIYYLFTFKRNMIERKLIEKVAKRNLKVTRSNG